MFHRVFHAADNQARTRNKMKQLLKLQRWLAPVTAACILAMPSVHAELIPVTEDIAEGTTVTWTATNEYRLDTVIYVQTNATLVIEPGTVIKGATNVTINRPGIPELVSALWITRGGRLMAEGTRENPIIFTTEGDNLDGNIPPTETALWGGVVIMGNAVINTAGNAAGNAATPRFDAYEGVDVDENTGLPLPEHRFGGDNDADNSGVLRYVSIRHAGRIFQQAAELNCLTMGGVGSGTVLEYIEVFAGSDDGFEWWGGTVNSKYLLSAFIEDDDFDTDQGYRGTNQFWFAIKPPWAGTGDSRGMESDGDLNQSALGELPIARWYAYNATIVGRGKSETATDLGRAWVVRDETAVNVANSVFAEWNQGLLLELDGLYNFTNTTVLGSIQNNLWDVNVNANAEGQFIFDTAAFNNTVGGAMLGGVSYTNNSILDPRPLPGSPVYSDVLPGAPTAVNYRGAFSGPSDDWADGWTALSRYGYLKAAATGVQAPMLMATKSGVNLIITLASQTGVLYRLESSANFASWSPVGGAGGSRAGTGDNISFTVNTSAGTRFYRVSASAQ
jgi:hypothetical protein